jgi:sugar lactone lactonase YvrE
MTWNFTIVNGPYGGVTEGPAWDGSGLLFTHIPSSRILRFDPQTRGSSLYRENTNDGGVEPLDACPATVLAGKNGTEPLSANDDFVAVAA